MSIICVYALPLRREEGPSAARRCPSAIGRAECLGPAVYSGFRAPATSHINASKCPHPIVCSDLQQCSSNCILLLRRAYQVWCCLDLKLAELTLPGSNGHIDRRYVQKKRYNPAHKMVHPGVVVQSLPAGRGQQTPVPAWMRAKARSLALNREGSSIKRRVARPQQPGGA